MKITNYYPNQKVKSEYNYHNNHITGTYKSYYHTGKLQFIKHYDSQGNPINTHHYYHPNGKIQTEKTYQNGLLHGYLKTYYESGLLESIENYNQGVLQGYSKCWDVTGEPILLIYFHQDKPLYATYYQPKLHYAISINDELITVGVKEYDAYLKSILQPN